MAKKQKGKAPKATDLPARYDAAFSKGKMDGRGRVAKSLHERGGAFISDLGGLASLSSQELSLVKRILHLERMIEKRELSMAHGGPIDENAHIAGLNCLSGLFSKLGLKRRVKQIQLSDYLKTKPGPDVQVQPANDGHNQKETLS
jgi:hypothetical protein